MQVVSFWLSFLVCHVIQHHPGFPCGGAEDREEGSEDPEVQGKIGF